MSHRKRSGDLSIVERMGGANPLPLLTGKLYHPPVTPELERRTRLAERPDPNRQRPLTLISTSAGCGKTMQDRRVRTQR